MKQKQLTKSFIMMKNPLVHMFVYIISVLYGLVGPVVGGIPDNTVR